MNGSNFSNWNEQIFITMGYLNLDLAQQVEEPLMSSSGSTLDAKTLYEKWEHSNQMSLIIIKNKIAKNIISSIPASTKVKELISSFYGTIICSGIN